MKSITTLVVLLFLSCHLYASEQANLLLTGIQQNGLPEKATLPNGCKTEISQNGLSINFSKPASLKYRIYITPEISRLYLGCNLTTEKFKSGKESWQNARIAVRFYDENKTMVGGWPKVIEETKESNGSSHYMVYDIPVGAKIAVFEPANFGSTGFVNFKDIVIYATPKNLLLPPNPGCFSTQRHIENITVNTSDTGVDITINGNGSLRTSIPVSPDWKSLTLSMKWKTTDVVKGDQSWKDARVALRFYGPKGGVGKWPKIPNNKGNNDWAEFSQTYEIPQGAISFSVEPANFGKSGLVEIQMLKLTADSNK